MVRTNCLALLLAMSSFAAAQVVHVDQHNGAADLWGGLYQQGRKITFHGRVTGIEITKASPGKDSEVTLLVRNTDAGGGTAVVDLGPQWYVSHQTAKVRVKDRVQVIGSKVMVDGRGIILAKLIQVNGQGGLVVSLRRDSGRAYWLSSENATNGSIPTGPNVLTGEVSSIGTYTVDNVPYGEAVIKTDNGSLNIDLGPAWYYQHQDVQYSVGDHLSIVAGGAPFTVGPNTIWQSYSIYNGPNVYTLRNANGVPVYYWGN